jgi:hypothetical protein
MTIATPLHRTGLALTLSAARIEAQSLSDELLALDEPYIGRMTDVTVKCDLEHVKKYADRISAMCGAEIDKLVERLNRHSVVAAE